jgi:DNA-binding MarR family transcriptional regulator
LFPCTVSIVPSPTAGYLVWLLSTRWRAAVDRAVAPLGLTHAQYSLLASLYGQSRAGAQPSQRELADVSGLEPIYVSKLVRALAQAGLVDRTTHPADPRAVQLRLTRPGTATITRAIDIVHALHADLTAAIGGPGSAQHQQLVTTLQTLLGAAPPMTEGAATNQNGSPAMTQTTPTLTGQDIGEAQGAVRALLDDVLAKTGVTSTEYIVLRVLTARGAAGSPAEFHEFLAGQRQLDLDRTAVADLLAGLEARGLIAGSAPDSAGPTRLTEAGTARHAELTARVNEVTRRLYGELDQNDLATAHRVLRDVVERAGRLRGEL